MNDRSDERFETELRKLKPAALPENLAERLAAARPETSARREVSVSSAQPIWWRSLRWLAPLAAATSVAVLFVWHSVESGAPRSTQNVASAKPAKAGDVEVDEDLVAAFDTVAAMPDGRPVRFRCREWNDQIVLRDPGQGIVIEQSVPRVEVEPVSFDVY